MPYTTNVSGTTITAAWGNANVRDQVTTPFANVAARDSAITSPVNGMFATTTGDGYLWRYNGSKWILDQVWVYKTAAQGTGANNTTLANVTDFAIPVEANSKYAFDSWVSYTATQASDLKLGWTLPSSASMKWSTYAPPSTSTGFTDIYQGVSSGTGPLILGGQTGTPMLARLSGLITVAGTAGTAQLQFAQNANDAAAAVIDGDSWLTFKQVS